MMLLGLTLSAFALVLFGQTWSFRSTMVLQTLMAASMAMMITPSLAYMADATSQQAVGSFGVAYGLYNMAWGAGLLGGPALGGFLFERMGFGRLAFLWAPALLLITLMLARIQSDSSKGRKPT